MAERDDAEPGSPEARDQVSRRLGYMFEAPDLLRDALTHRSFRNERPLAAPSDNERLEFLGDALLGLGVAALLYRTLPDAREGELTRKRADLVCESGLAEVALELKLGQALRLGKGEGRSGGRTKPRLLASALEALIGAVYLDGGEQAAFAAVERLFAKRITGAPPRQDPKSELQERIQEGGSAPPSYAVVRTEGPDHDQTFFIALSIAEDVVCEGVGRSKGEAERDAASKALVLLEARAADAPDEGED